MLTEEGRKKKIEGGRKGGKAKVPKGFSKMNPERRRQLAIQARQKQLNRKANEAPASEHERDQI